MISAINYVKNPNRVCIPSFRGNNIIPLNDGMDSYTPSVRTFDGNLSDLEADFILNETQKPGNYIGAGFTASVYRTGDYAIKSPKIDLNDKCLTFCNNDKILKEYFS